MEVNVLEEKHQGRTLLRPTASPQLHMTLVGNLTSYRQRCAELPHNNVIQ